MLFSPDLFVVGGGVSRKHEKYLPLLDLKTPIVPAQLLNTAGIVGAAYQPPERAPPDEAASAPARRESGPVTQGGWM